MNDAEYLSMFLFIHFRTTGLYIDHLTTRNSYGNFTQRRKERDEWIDTEEAVFFIWQPIAVEFLLVIVFQAKKNITSIQKPNISLTCKT